jgi:poly-gamma-glutamate capsule biosynthesis protein CapA/YwtB (metallophosphatase superfamily)
VSVAALVVAVVLAAIFVSQMSARHGRPRASPSPAASSPRLANAGPSRTPAAGSPLLPDWRGDGKPVTLAFGGDVHFEGVLADRLAADPATALDGLPALFAGADLSMVNFESALISGPCTDPQPKQYRFYAPPAALTAFKDAHVTLVTEANNHGEDCGRPGLAQSLEIAKSARFPVIGIGANASQALRPYRTTINGQRIAIFAATEVIDSDLMTSWTATSTQPGVASAYQEGELVSAVQAVRKDSDTVIVFLHWGTETEQCPNPVQEPLAGALVKAGADIVIGSHAHVQLGAGYLGSALVDYGLGNLAFYDTSPPETYSGTLGVTVTGRHIDSYSWRPAEISNGVPVPLTGTSAADAIRRWRGLRGCTNLSATARASTSTTQTETRPFAGPSVTPLPG